MHDGVSGVVEKEGCLIVVSRFGAARLLWPFSETAARGSLDRQQRGRGAYLCSAQDHITNEADDVPTTTMGAALLALLPTCCCGGGLRSDGTLLPNNHHLGISIRLML